MKQISLFLIFFVVVLSCSDIHKPAQLEKISTLNATLDSLHKVVLVNQLDSANSYSLLSHDVELRIKNNYFADTIDMELGKKMDAYKVMRRKWSPLGYEYRNLLKGIAETKESLRQLKHDIDNGDGSREKYDQYLAFESSKVEQLNLLSDQYVTTRAQTFKTFHDLHEELDAFSRELVRKAENKRK